MNNEEIKIDELLNSYVDGELTVRQRTEVKRMAANDPGIAKRLRQLQKCRMLVSALPVANAPSDIMENVKASLEARNRSSVEMSVQKSGKTGFVLFRRILAAAAMISIAAILVIVINMLASSHRQTTSGGGVKTVADMRFSGRLELKTNDIKAVSSVITRAIDKSGLTRSVTILKESGREIYTLNCSRESLNKVLSDLNANWDKLYSAALSVDTKVFGQSVEIKAIIPSQIEKIVSQADESQAIETAKNIAITNSIGQLLHDSRIGSSRAGISPGLIGTEPVLAKYYPPNGHDNGEKTIQLRIILSR